MPKWAIIGQFTVDADSPDEAIALLKAEMAMKLQSVGVHRGSLSSARTRMAPILPLQPHEAFMPGKSPHLAGHRGQPLPCPP
jgi:hypothetical protein